MPMLRCDHKMWLMPHLGVTLVQVLENAEDRKDRVRSFGLTPLPHFDCLPDSGTPSGHSH